MSRYFRSCSLKGRRSEEVGAVFSGELREKRAVVGN
jgi:hypothetical protein